MKKQMGFTLIELMIVVAIIAILAAIAIPAYNGYIAEANATRVNTAFEEAINAAKSEMAKRQTILARGGSYTNLDAAGWIGVVNPDGKYAPGGSVLAFDTAEDGSTGVIGVTAVTTNPPSVMFTRPAYDADGSGTPSGTSDLTKKTANIDATSRVVYGT